MKKLLTAIAITISSISASHAANVDLSTFTVSGTGSTTPSFATISGTSSLSGTVSGVTSFDWLFKANDYLPYNDYSYFVTTSTGTTTLSSVSAVGNYGSSGWNTFTFTSAYSGVLTFGVKNVGDTVLNSDLSIKNVSAVPEPETYALLLAGMGLVGAMARRRKQAALTA